MDMFILQANFSEINLVQGDTVPLKEKEIEWLIENEMLLSKNLQYDKNFHENQLVGN